MQSIKMVIVGDGGVGKTSLCISYTTKMFPSEYIPTVFDSYAVTIPVGTESWIFGLWDTAGQPEYDRLRPLSYPQTDVFVACFSVGLPASFENIKHKWFPEVHHHCPGVPCLIVATQIDLRSDQQAVQKMTKLWQRPVSYHEGLGLARELGATRYLECSAKTREGVDDVFAQAIAAAVAFITGKKSRRCIVL
ncbi:cell division control protein 42 [Mycena rebaudengoi]|nr:cell division control protein 42 [Mycena rebaudengoi]